MGRSGFQEHYLRLFLDKELYVAFIRLSARAREGLEV